MDKKNLKQLKSPNAKSGTNLATVKKIFNMTLQLLFWIILGTGILMLGSRGLTGLLTRNQIKTEEAVIPQTVAIVFGAGLQRDGSPSPVLQDRVKTGAELYFSGKAQILLLTGDNRFIDYNEPGAMRAYALQLGVPEEAIVLDYAGRRTYDSCYRAKHIFEVDQAILVTQAYHLPRALFLCNQLGISAQGVSADQRMYRKSSLLIWNIREVPASFMALIDVWVRHPLPVMGTPEPISNNEE
jgi:SanA protein